MHRCGQEPATAPIHAYYPSASQAQMGTDIEPGHEVPREQGESSLWFWASPGCCKPEEARCKGWLQVSATVPGAGLSGQRLSSACPSPLASLSGQPLVSACPSLQALCTASWEPLLCVSFPLQELSALRKTRHPHQRISQTYRNVLYLLIINGIVSSLGT